MPRQPACSTPPRSCRRLFKDKLNVVPLPYRGVSVQGHDGRTTKHGIASFFSAGRRTAGLSLSVLRARTEEHAIIAVDATNREPLSRRSCMWRSLARPDPR